MKVVWAPTAVNRAHEEAEFIAQDKPHAAWRWLEDLFAATDRLQIFPQSGSVVPEIGGSNHRQINFRSHRIIYKIDAERVVILTVRRHRQRLNTDDFVQ